VCPAVSEDDGLTFYESAFAIERFLGATLTYCGFLFFLENISLLKIF
jgi:hypothetical protein